ncbi:MAG: hypothetical protein RL538_603 [Candidatus Parcubacteria bacterium]|jgi:hypothetical protein
MKSPEAIRNTPVSLDKREREFDAGDLQSEIGQESDFRRLEDVTLELDGLLETSVEGKYEALVEEIRQEKISWITSPEFARRISLTGASEEDVGQIRDWVLDNIKNGEVRIFAPNDIALLRERLMEFSKLSSGDSVSLEQGNGFYVNGNVSNLPEKFLNNVYIPEQTFVPKTYPITNSTETLLSHEIGHQAQDGVLRSELYQDWSPRLKEGSPDPEYVGNIEETDVRIRSMFRCLRNVFDANQEAFDEVHIELLRDMQKEGVLERDVTDLLDHFDDDELVRIANYLPAI